MSCNKYSLLNICGFWRPVREKKFQFQTGPQCKKGCRPLD